MKTERIFDHPAWWRALTLTERRGILPRDKPPTPNRLEKVERRLAEWRSQAPFRNEEWLQRRLEIDDLDLGTFRALLGETDTSLQHRLPKAIPWLFDLEQIFVGSCSDRPEGRLPIIGPLISQTAERLAQLVRELAGQGRGARIDLERVVTSIISAIVTRVDGMLSRAVALEMRVASLRGEIDAGSPQIQFQAFLERLRNPTQALLFLREYPVLARDLQLCIDDLAGAGAELLRRLSADWERIRATFWSDHDPGHLANLRMGAGDLHRRGRSVCLLTFGEGASLIYKPRPLGIDRHFAQLVDWLNRRGALDLRIPRVVDCSDYGWCEFVENAPCCDIAEVRRFYKRQGSLLAILHVLNANDFHRENLIAAGEHPVPVDLETLCGPDYGQAREESYDTDAEFELQNSVVRVMLLPFLQEGRGRTVVDKSGLGGDGGQLSINPEPEWEGLGSADLRLVWKRKQLPPTPNRPILDGEPLNALHFSDEIEQGFASTYRLLMSCRGELLAEVGPIAAMADDEVRVIFRTSELYSMLLDRSYHPELLADGIERERLFDHLWFGIDRSLFSRVTLRLLPYEREDLWRNEIPHFTTRVGSRDLLTSQGERLPDFFFRSGVEMVRYRLEQLSDEDLGRQLWYVRASLTTLDMNERPYFGRYSPRADPMPPSRDRLLAQVVAIAQRLLALARWKEDRTSWVGLAHAESHGWHLRPLQTDFYSGLPGIALFLAYAGTICGREDFRTAAEGAVATLRNQMRRRRAGLEFLGAFDGWGGLLYSWLHLACLWQQDRLIAEAEAMVANLDELAPIDDQLDMLRGSAGAIVPLLNLYRTTGCERALSLSHYLGERLVALARPCEGGLGWLGVTFPVHPLTGFSHGASGFAWALAELFAVNGDPMLARTVIAASTFERSFFYPEAMEWADLRSGRPGPDKPPEFMTAWCHGACGIGMARLGMRQHLRDEAIDRDLRIALNTTFEKGFGSNHSLCHGDLGSLMLLLQANRQLPGEGWDQRLATRTAQTLASIEDHGWQCGVSLGVETPGLMDGLAGIGLGLLYLADPDRIPAVLMLEGPKNPAKWAPESTHLHEE